MKHNHVHKVALKKTYKKACKYDYTTSKSSFMNEAPCCIQFIAAIQVTDLSKN